MDQKISPPPDYLYNQHPGVVVAQPGGVTTTTTFVTQQPVSKVQWSSGIFDCFQDLESCMGVWCFNAIYVGCLSQRMGENCCVGCCLQGLWPMRSAFKERHHIEGSMCEDFFMANFCGMCAACQLSREMNYYSYPKFM